MKRQKKFIVAGSTGSFKRMTKETVKNFRCLNKKRKKKRGKKKRVHPHSLILGRVTDLVEDLADGVVLCQLAQVLTKKKLKFKLNATLAAQMMDNCTVALKELEAQYHLPAVANPKSFVSKDQRLVLGFLWQLVQNEMVRNIPHFDVKKGSDIRSEMYDWVEKYIEGDERKRKKFFFLLSNVFIFFPEKDIREFQTSLFENWDRKHLEMVEFCRFVCINPVLMLWI